MTTIIEMTVANHVCVGCGVCVSSCPKHVLVMNWNKHGEYNPIKIKKCDVECGLCVSVCPFAPESIDESEIGKRCFENHPEIQCNPEIGYYLSLWTGAVTDENNRWNSASGGFATWFFEHLLTEKIVDAVLCVVRSEESERLFQYMVCTTKEEIHSAAGSVYYPVEMADVLTYVLSHDGKYAVIGLPCFIKAVRLAQLKSKTLKDRLILLAGLTCGCTPNKNFTTYAAYCSGLLSPIRSVKFRQKDAVSTSSNYISHFCGINGENTHVSWNDAKLWPMWRAMELHACDCCDDIFAECADVTFMDAWLPEYCSDSRGHSICIIRSPAVEKLWIHGVENKDLVVTPLSIDKVILSQYGLIQRKRSILQYRLNLMEKFGYQIPKKRVFEENDTISFLERFRCEKEFHVQRLCQTEWLSCNGDCKHMKKWITHQWKEPFYIQILAVIRHIQYKIKR